MPAGGKYKIFPLLGNGAKNYCGYTFGPLAEAGDAWSERSSALVNRIGVTTGDVYSEYADANRLIGQSERILYPGTPERSKVAILLPSASGLWDTQPQTPYYALEIYGLYYAISHGYNISVDFVDDTDIGDGALTDNDYYVLYAVGPNVSTAAQTAIANWINTCGAHNRQLVLAPGAGVADEYNTPTGGFDALAGLSPSGRTANRDAAGLYSSFDPYIDAYSARVQVANKDFYFDGETMNIRGPFQALAPLPAAAGPNWIDLVYATGGPALEAACVTKTYACGGLINAVTAFGFFPGYQYYASPNASHTNQLPQNWSIMAREIAMMPVIRQNLPRTVHVYNGKGPAGQTLGETNAYLTASPVEALRVNVGDASPTAVGVVLINWGGATIDDLKFKVFNGIASPTTFALASGAPLSDKRDEDGANAATLTLHDVDVVMISK